MKSIKSLKNILALVLVLLSTVSCGLISVERLDSRTEYTNIETSSESVIGVMATPESSANTVDESVTTAESTTEITTETAQELPEIMLDSDSFVAVEQLLSAPPVHGARVAFCYEDLTTGTAYSYNGDEVMWSASVMKLPFVLSILYKAETEDMGLDDIFVYSGNEDPSGTGKIKSMPIGSSFTNIELIEYALQYSDNIAYRYLQKKHGNDTYFEYVRSIGADSFTKNSGWGTSAADCAKMLRSALEYLEGGYTYSDRIKYAMLHTEHQVMLSPGLSGKDFARKYGWDEDGYNDVGIVYDEHPYIIVFLSDMTSGDRGINGYITEIARTVNEIHEKMWGTTDDTSAYTVINTMQENLLWDAEREN